MSRPAGSCGESESLEVADALVRLLGFSTSAFSTSSEGVSGGADAVGSGEALSPSVIEDLAEDARRFHVRVVREVVWSFRGRREGRSARIKEGLGVAEVLSSDRDRRITEERINFVSSESTSSLSTEY